MIFCLQSYFGYFLPISPVTYISLSFYWYLGFGLLPLVCIPRLYSFTAFSIDYSFYPIKARLVSHFYKAYLESSSVHMSFCTTNEATCLEILFIPNLPQISDRTLYTMLKIPNSYWPALYFQESDQTKNGILLPFSAVVLSKPLILALADFKCVYTSM